MITFKESPIFTKQIDKYLSDEEYAALQWELLSNPSVGVLIPDSGGLRKIRWKTERVVSAAAIASFTIGEISKEIFGY